MSDSQFDDSRVSFTGKDFSFRKGLVGGPEVPELGSAPKSGAELRERFIRKNGLDSVSQLRGGLGQGLEQIERQLSDVLQSDCFTARLRRTVHELIDSHRVELAGLDRVMLGEQFVSALAQQLRDISRETFDMYRRQEKLGHLRAEDMSIRNLLQTKRIAKRILRECIGRELGLGANATNRMLGDLVPAIQRDIGLTFVEEGKTENFSPHQLRFLRVGQVGCDFLSRHDEMRIARLVSSEKLEDFLDILESVKNLPKIPAVMERVRVAESRERRFKRELAMSLASVEGERRDGISQAVVSLFAELFERPDLQIHLFHNNNCSRFIQAFIEGKREEYLILRCVSCPDYSGEIQAGANGSENWSFDFRDLGSREGVVAKKGIPFVTALSEVARRHIERVEVEHVMPSFEVAGGFQGQGDSGVILTREEALARLKQSSRLIERRLQERGVEGRSTLSNELIDDEDFAKLKAAVQSDVLLQMEGGAEFEALSEFLIRSRVSLYDRWHVGPEGETSEQKHARLRSEVLFPQMAEYIVTGAVLTNERNSILLAYDSAIMGEVYAFMNLPVLFGQGRDALNYEGA